VARAEIVTLIGANGAGKTTTLRAVSGMLRPAEARSSTRESRSPASSRTGLWLAPLPRSGGPRHFSQPDRHENLELGAFLRRDVQGIAQDMERGFTLFPRLKERARQMAERFRAASSRCWRCAAP